MVHVAFQTLHNVVQVKKCSFVAGWRNAKRRKSIRAFAQQAEIRLITSDVDGTLLDSQQRLTPLVEKAIKLSRSVGVPVSIIMLSSYSLTYLFPLGSVSFLRCIQSSSILSHTCEWHAESAA